MEKIIWQDRKHFMWFPFSFTKYEIKNERLYQETGLISTHYDELLLYRVTDLCLKRSLAQKIFGTGTIVLYTKADSDKEVLLKNIKNPKEVKDLVSKLVEEARNRKKVVGKEFFNNDIEIDDDYDY
ncbi:PH domain-containing protein [uncultured Thomasclavelia sp.]|uniref:PH domain-containing protein n=1 Tax=uncultured Thomasclavelia sp. TaxID=3025759 RepID=UPI0025CCDFD1|nr:PH domain-containing protein [uncultured Thomasclavelia sp.]